MKENFLINYMEQRYKKQVSDEKTSKDPGSVVTISRETGCPAKRIAKLLALSLNKQKTEGNNWKCVSKEILSEAAKELDMAPSQIQYVFDFEKKSTWDEILGSFSTKYYKSDRKIRKTIADVIRTIAISGYAIIIGRGSVAITKDLPKALHINLEAPMEWRSEILCEKMNVPVEEARKYAITTDRKREEFRDSFYGKNTDYTTFDVTFNCMRFTDNEIVESIVNIMQLRKLIP